MLAAHMARLTSRRERTALARSLRATAEKCVEPHTMWSSRVLPHRGNVLQAMPLIADVIERLEATTPIHPLGCARLRLLMSDGAGPFYFGRGGTLTAPLRAVLAEL